MTPTTASPRVLAAALLAIAFLVGVLGGIVFDRFVLLPPRLRALRAGGDGWHHGVSAEARRGRERFAMRLLDELDLSPEQRAQAESVLARQHERSRAIMDRSRPELRAIAEETHAELRAILTPAQWERLQELEKLHRARRGRRGEPR